MFIKDSNSWSSGGAAEPTRSVGILTTFMNTARRVQRHVIQASVKENPFLTPSAAFPSCWTDTA